MFQELYIMLHLVIEWFGVVTDGFVAVCGFVACVAGTFLPFIQPD